MVENLLSILKNLKNDTKILNYIMFTSLFLCGAFICNVNQSFVSIWKMFFGFDLSNFLLITYKYLIFAYKIVFCGFIILIFFMSIYLGLESITFFKHRFKTSFLRSWNKFVMTSNNLKIFGTCIYYILYLMLRAFDYILLMIISNGALVISENTDINIIVGITKNVLSEKYGGLFLIILCCFSLLILLGKLRDFWSNADQKLSESSVILNEKG